MATSKQSPFKASVALLVLSTLVGCAALLAVHGAARAGAAAGIAVGVLASGTALAFLALAFNRGIKLLLGALAAGFLVRMLLVAGGLLASLALKGDVMAFAVAFFALYFAHQAIELTLVVRAARPLTAEGQT